MRLNERLLELRKASGKSQKECADELGISNSKYNKWENGVNSPDYETLCLLADFYHTTTDFLLGRTDVKSVDTNIQMICEYTGLSEKAIEEIKRPKDAPINDDGYYFKMQNLIFENTYFHLLLIYICKYISSITAETMYFRLWDRFFPEDEIEKPGFDWESSDEKFYKEILRIANSPKYPSLIKDNLKAVELLFSMAESEPVSALTPVFDSDEISLSMLSEYHANKELSRLLEALSDIAKKSPLLDLDDNNDKGGEYGGKA